MISFLPADPFPLLPLGSYSYQEAQEHAVLVDAWLGLNTSEIESKVRAHTAANFKSTHQNWEHISVQAMQTPYVELRNILQQLDIQPGSHITDLGAAYSRLGFILDRHYPGVCFDGYELEDLRVQETRRVFGSTEQSLIRFHTADLASADFRLPMADIYFIFDYGSEKDVRKTLQDLQRLALRRRVQIAARGRLSRFLIHQEHPWLYQVNPPVHFDFFSIYKS